MVLIFGGTSEGRFVEGMLQEMNIPFHYSTKTESNHGSFPLGTYRFGALDAATMQQYMLLHKVDLVINAAHPFASELHYCIANVCKKIKVPVWRIEREKLPIVEHPNVFYLDSYQEIMALLLTDKYRSKRVLALTGVQSIGKFDSYWKDYKMYFRILNRKSSIEKALQQGFPKKNLILDYPSNNPLDEKKVYQNCRAEIILTKDSGSSGFLDVKVAAAVDLQLPIIILKRPKIDYDFHFFYQIDPMKKALNHFINSSDDFEGG